MIEAVECARKYDTIVSYDLNYRASLWKSQGGKEGAQKINRNIAQYVDVMIGNEEDFTACLGLCECFFFFVFFFGLFLWFFFLAELPPPLGRPPC